jgi:signal transduction histidine kinase
MFGFGLADGLYLALLTLVNRGFESGMFWVFFGLIVVNAISLPLATQQLVLNLLLSALYMAAGIASANIEMSLPSASENGQALGSISQFLLQLIVLWLLTACCFGVQVLVARQRQAEEEAREFATRQGQLRTAGRLAAEIAHQIKNPLAIINNTTFSVRRALASGRTDVAPQLAIIEEEIERSDRILTQLMGYARLAEGRVEKLNVIEEVERALGEVLPVGGGFEVCVTRDFAPLLPPLFMQRGHLSTILVNLLQNAREAVGGKGELRVAAKLAPDFSVQIVIEDNGPGVPTEKTEQIFEAYFTTKEKGTGLGLAIVKHNVDLYGGRIHVESALGKGARFVLVFPARALNDPTKHG